MADFIAALLSAGACSSTQLPAGTQGHSAISQTRRLVLDHGQEAVLQVLQTHVAACQPMLFKAIKAILLATRMAAFGASATPEDAAACASLRSALFGRLPAWAHGADEQQYAADLVAAFLPDVEHLPAADLASLISAALAGMEQKQPHCCVLLELLPPCLNALATAAPDADADGGAGGEPSCDDAAAAGDEAVGADGAGAAAASVANAARHRDAAIHRLLHCQWQPEHVCAILTVLKGMPLPREQLKNLLTKAMRASKSVGLQQLPPILYQLLLLAAAVPGMRVFTLRLITSLFEMLEAQPSGNSDQGAAGGDGGDGEVPPPPQQEQQQPAAAAAPALPSATLLQVQATLLMHISTMLKYDGALGSEWLKWMAREMGIITAKAFMLEVLMTMAQCPKLEAPVLQLFKRTISEACEEEAAANSAISSSNGGGGGASSWMAGLQPVTKCLTVQDLQDGLLKAVRCSAYVSELVAPGLLQLASALVGTSCSSPLHVVLAMKQGGSLPPQAPASARAVVLGLRLLQEVFEVHAEARGEVLKVVQAKLSCPANLDAALPIVLLLGRISQQQPALLTSYMPQLKECLSSFAGLSSDTAMALLLAVWPLCRVRGDLQDFVIMLLRKMMYRQDVCGRLIAIRGFLRLICQALQDSPSPVAASLDPSAASCSQASLSQVSSLSGSRGVNLLQELTGVLRRALSQQAPVREALYAGILQVLAADPASLELLAELLLPHLRSFIVEDAQALPPLLLHKCADLNQADVVLLEPLPALLACVHRLGAAASSAAAAAAAARGPGSLVGSETWPGMDAGEEGGEQSSSALKACFASIRTRLGECQLDHWDLGSAADLNPGQLDGLVGQLHAANLLGSLQVVIEDVVADAQRLAKEQPDAEHRDGGAVNRLGRELQHLFELHNQAYQLALEGSRAGAKRGRKPGAGGPDGNSTVPEAPAAGHKRGRPCDAYTPVHKQCPHFTAACLATLCNAIVDDGLMQLPSSFDVAGPNHHVQLARNAAFRAAVLRSCANLLERAQAAAATSALLQGSGGAAAGSGGEAPAAADAGAGAGSEVLELGPALLKVAKLVMQTATAGGRPGCKPPVSSTSTDARKQAAGAAAAAAGDGYETLEHLSAVALLQLLKVADSTQQLAALFRQVPLEDGSVPPSEQDGDAAGDGAAAADEGQDGDEAMADAAGGGNAAPAPEQPAGVSRQAAARGRARGSKPGTADAVGREVAAAVMPRLPQLLECADRLLEQGCFKEAQVMVECLMLLGKRLGAPAPGAGADGAQQQQQQQQCEPAFAALSRWAHQAMQQTAPEVRSLPLVRALLELYIRFHGKDSVIPLATTMRAINEVVGEATEVTQDTQEHGTILPMLISSKTAQPAAVTPLSILEEGLAQLERLAGANLKGGVVQDEDSASTAKARQKLAAAMCKRLQELLKCLRVLVGTIIGAPSVIDHQTRVATRAYKLLTTLAKAHQLPKKPAGGAEAGGAARSLSPEFEALVGYVHKELSPALSLALKDMQGDDALVTLQRIRKDAKLMPALIYAIEAWEKQLVATGKAASKNLLRDARRTFCRDFKVTGRRPAGDAHGAQQQERGVAAGGGRGAGSGAHGGRGGRGSQQGRRADSGGGGGGAARGGRGAASGGRATTASGSRGTASRGASAADSAGGSNGAGGGSRRADEPDEDEGQGGYAAPDQLEEEDDGEGAAADADENVHHAQQRQGQRGGAFKAHAHAGGGRPPLHRTQC